MVNRSIFFTNANRNQNLTLQILSDDLTEVYETFMAVLSSVFLAGTAGGAAIEQTNQERDRLIINPKIATVKILDDDGISLWIRYFIITILFPIVAIIGFQSTVLNASEDSGGVYFHIAVLSGVLRVNVSINFSTIDNSAQDFLLHTQFSNDYDELHSFFLLK